MTERKKLVLNVHGYDLKFFIRLKLTYRKAGFTISSSHIFTLRIRHCTAVTRHQQKLISD